MYANTLRHDPDPKTPEAEAPAEDQRDGQSAAETAKSDEDFRITDWASL